MLRSLDLHRTKTPALRKREAKGISTKRLRRPQDLQGNTPVGPCSYIVHIRARYMGNHVGPNYILYLHMDPLGLVENV